MIILCRKVSRHINWVPDLEVSSVASYCQQQKFYRSSLQILLSVSYETAMICGVGKVYMFIII